MEHVSDIVARAAARVARRDRIPAVSGVSPDGGLFELVYEPSRALTAFALWKDGHWELVPEIMLADGKRLVPYSPQNNLLVHGVVRFAAGPEEYGTEAELVEAVAGFIHQYVDVPPHFERIATYYILLSWVYDAFNELPYLRVRGEPGCGKTRFLLTVGSLCYKPIFASGASTVSPLFRILDQIGGTLVIDESDFRFSDEKSELVKILNNGNTRGFPVLRTEQEPGTKEFNPRAHQVFGPKIVATRGFFDDKALESRFLSEHMDAEGLRDDIPINLPAEHAEEALRLRNRLLLFRFRNLKKPRMLAEVVDRGLEPRLNQIFAPLLSIVDDAATRRDLLELARSYQREIVADRGLGIEAEVLEVLRDLWTEGSSPPSVKAIAEVYAARHPLPEEHLSPKRIGWLLRRKLGLATVRSRDGYVIADSEGQKLARLFERYGLEQSPAESSPQGSSPSA